MLPNSDVHSIEPEDFLDEVHSFDHWFGAVEDYLKGLEHGHLAGLDEGVLDPGLRDRLISTLCNYAVAETAALEASEGEIAELSSLLETIRPGLQGIDPSLPKAEQVRLGVEANVRYSVQAMEEIIQRELANQREGTPPRVVGAVYELETGRVRLLPPLS